MRVLIAIALLLGVASASEPADACGNTPLSRPQTAKDKAEYEKWMGTIHFSRLQITGTRLPAAALQQITAKLSRSKIAGIEGLTEMVVSARDEFQQRGYFKVYIDPEFKLLSGSKCFHRASAVFRVDTGTKYRLGKVAFLHNDLASDELRALFPMKDGSTFDTSKIREGLENLRKAYGRRGYINFTAVPDTKIHEEQCLIDLNIDLDIGKQFHVRRIGVAGLTDDRFQKFYAVFPLKEGAVFDSKALENFFLENPEFAPRDFSIETDVLTTQDRDNSTIDLRIDLSGHHIKWPDMN